MFDCGAKVKDPYTKQAKVKKPNRSMVQVVKCLPNKFEALSSNSVPSPKERKENRKGGERREGEGRGQERKGRERKGEERRGKKGF
jgi:hypothetical protein